MGNLPGTASGPAQRRPRHHYKEPDVNSQERIIAAAFWAAALLLLVPSAQAAGGKRVKYREIPPSDVKIDPTAYKGEKIKIKDYFGRMLTSKTRDERNIWKREWPKERKMKSRDYIAFFTEESGEGSDMLCYVPITNKAATALLKEGLDEGARIMLKGTVMEREFGEKRNDPDITHFFVDAIKLDHDDADDEVRLFMAVDRLAQEIERPAKYSLPCPKCGKSVLTITIHKMQAGLDLNLACPHAGCKRTMTFKFYNK